MTAVIRIPISSRWLFCLVLKAMCMQTGATTPNIFGPITLGLLRLCLQCCVDGCNKSQQCWYLQCIVGKDTTLKTLETTCDARVYPKECWKSCANGSNIVALRSGITKQLLAQKFDRFYSNSQQDATTCNRVCKRTQRVTSNNVGRSANNVASVYTGLKTVMLLKFV